MHSPASHSVTKGTCRNKGKSKDKSKSEEKGKGKTENGKCANSGDGKGKNGTRRPVERGKQLIATIFWQLVSAFNIDDFSKLCRSSDGHGVTL